MSTVTSKTDLSGQNVYGIVYLEKEVMLRAMHKLGLVLHRANWRQHSSEVRFVGKIEDVSIELHTHIMVRGEEVRKGKFGWCFVQSNNPVSDETYTHFKLKGYIAENTSLKGKGRDRHAWKIYERIVRFLEIERGAQAPTETVDECQYLYGGISIHWVKPGYYLFDLKKNCYNLVTDTDALKEEEWEHLRLVGFYDIEEIGAS